MDAVVNEFARPVVAEAESMILEAIAAAMELFAKDDSDAPRAGAPTPAAGRRYPMAA